ncbi:MAG: class I SAM-dependent methyltransferase [Gemmatimonadales bacterium]
MKPEYARAYRDLYQRHWWWRAREAVLLREIEPHAPAGGWQTILDVGCGDGLFFDRLRAFGEPWGVEVDASLVPPDSPHRSHIHIGGFDGTYRAPGPIGLVLMLDVLEHLHEPVQALRHARNLLAPHGNVLITVPAFRVLWTRHDDLNQHLVRYTRTTLNRVVRAAGLIPVSSRYLFHWLFPSKLVVRALERLALSAGGPATVPPTAINRALYYLCRAEERSLGWARLPLGTSLLAWCVKGAEQALAPEGPRDAAATAAGGRQVTPAA